MLESQQRQQFQLFLVRVAAGLAGFVVDDSCLVAIDDEQVGDASEPHILVTEPAGLHVLSQAHLMFTQLIAGQFFQWV